MLERTAIRDDLFTGFNATSSIIQAGTFVCTDGIHDADSVLICSAVATTAEMHVAGMCVRDIGVNQRGGVLITGTVSGYDTSGYGLGDVLYIHPTVAGSLTNTRPEYPYIARPVARVRSVGVSGSIDLLIANFRDERGIGTDTTGRIPIGMLNTTGTPSVNTVLAGDGSWVARISVGTSPPSNPAVNDLWVDTN